VDHLFSDFTDPTYQLLSLMISSLATLRGHVPKGSLELLIIKLQHSTTETLHLMEDIRAEVASFGAQDHVALRKQCVLFLEVDRPILITLTEVNA
jgi:hypothetical protein